MEIAKFVFSLFLAIGSLLIFWYVRGKSWEMSYYTIATNDYVTIMAVTESKEVILVRQYRHTLDEYALELPSGHVEKDERPLDAAKRELLEETGFTVSEPELLGVLCPDSGRFENRLWCYFAEGAMYSKEYGQSQEADIEVRFEPFSSFPGLIAQGALKNALDLSLTSLAFAKGKMKV
jgi:8-oxo-dGTP pyrophosphatase MutT (NUDIX family)